ncbi:MAG: hypothetical protein MJZ11_08110 [Lachnospiraceae bacterium]|nr:hypothetical protein [Lachnospiraceae bacterium]
MSDVEKKLQNEMLMRNIYNAEKRGYYVVECATNLPYDEVNRRYDALRKQGSTQSRKHKHRY